MCPNGIGVSCSSLAISTTGLAIIGAVLLAVGIALAVALYKAKVSDSTVYINGTIFNF